MATQTIIRHRLNRTNEPSTSATATVFASGDTLQFPMDDKGIIFRIKANAGGFITFTKGNGVSGVVDIVIPVEANKELYIQLDTSAFEQITGGGKGLCLATVNFAGEASVVNGL